MIEARSRSSRRTHELHIIRLSGEHTGGQFALIEHHNSRGAAAPWHRHRYDDETFSVLEGEVAVWCGDPTRPILRAGPGNSIFLPRQVPHTYRRRLRDGPHA